MYGGRPRHAPKRFGSFGDPDREPTQAEIDFYASLARLRQKRLAQEAKAAKQAKGKGAHKGAEKGAEKGTDKGSDNEKGSDGSGTSKESRVLGVTVRRKSSGGAAKKPVALVLPEVPVSPYDHRRLVLSSLGLPDRTAPPVFEANRFEARARAASEGAQTPKKSTSDLRRGFGFHDRPLPQAVEEEPHVPTAVDPILVPSRYRSATPGHEGTPQRQRDTATPNAEAATTTGRGRSPKPAPEARSVLQKIADAVVGRSPHGSERDATQSVPSATPTQSPASLSVTRTADDSDDELALEERVLRTMRVFNREHMNAGAFIIRGLSDEQVDTLEWLLAQRRQMQQQQQQQAGTAATAATTAAAATAPANTTAPPRTAVTSSIPAVSPTEAMSAIEQFLELQAQMAQHSADSTRATAPAAAAAVPPAAATVTTQPPAPPAAFPAAPSPISRVATTPTLMHRFPGGGREEAGLSHDPAPLALPPVQKQPSARAAPAPPRGTPQPPPSAPVVFVPPPAPLHSQETGEHTPAPPPPARRSIREASKTHEGRRVHRTRRFKGIHCTSAAAAQRGVADKKRIRPAHTMRPQDVRGAAAAISTTASTSQLVEEACRRYADECRREQAALQASIRRERAQAAAAASSAARTLRVVPVEPSAPPTRPAFPVARGCRSPSQPDDVNAAHRTADEQRRYSFLAHIVDDDDGSHGLNSTRSSPMELNDPLYGYRHVDSQDASMESSLMDLSPGAVNWVTPLKRVNAFRRERVPSAVSLAEQNALADASTSSFFVHSDRSSPLLTVAEAMDALRAEFLNEGSPSAGVRVGGGGGRAESIRQRTSFAWRDNSPFSRPSVMQPRDSRLRVAGNVLSSSTSSPPAMWGGASQTSTDDDPITELGEH